MTHDETYFYPETLEEYVMCFGMKCETSHHALNDYWTEIVFEFSELIEIGDNCYLDHRLKLPTINDLKDDDVIKTTFIIPFEDPEYKINELHFWSDIKGEENQYHKLELHKGNMWLPIKGGEG